MKTWNEHTHFAALDWASDHHDLTVINREGEVVLEKRYAHSGEGWRQLREALGVYPQLPVAIETNQGIVVDLLLQAQVQVYPVNPKAAKYYRERQKPSGAKSDQIDALSLALALRSDGHQWKALQPEDTLTEKLRLLCRDEMSLIEQQTQMVNQLTAALHTYYPAALEAFDDWTAPGAWAFLETFPDPKTLMKAGKRRWEKFLHDHKLWRTSTLESRLEVFAHATDLVASPAATQAKQMLALTLVKLLQTLREQLLLYRKLIEELFAQHPDHDLFGSLPGAGAKLAPRLLSEVGSQRDRFCSAESLQKYAGTAPCSFQSGQIHRVFLRRGVNHYLRSTIHLWSDQSRHQCTWAQTYYKAQRERGKSHACALRCLGQRWLKILWKMWQTNTPYHEAFHTKNQTLHGSWVLSLAS